MTKLRLIRAIWTSGVLTLALGGGLAYADSGAAASSPAITNTNSSTTVISPSNSTTDTNSTAVSSTQATAGNAVTSAGQLQTDFTQQITAQSEQSAKSSLSAVATPPSQGGDQSNAQAASGSLKIGAVTQASEDQPSQGQATQFTPPQLSAWVKSYDNSVAAAATVQTSTPVLKQPDNPVTPASPQLPTLPPSNPAAILQQLSLLLAGSVKSVLLGLGGLPPAGGTVPQLFIMSVIVGVILPIVASLFLKYSEIEGFARAPRGSTPSIHAYKPFATPLRMSLIVLGVP